MNTDIVKQRVERFKELVKQGSSIRKAMRECKLQPRNYKKFYDEIWSDPDMEPYRPESFRKRVAEKPPEVEAADERLAGYGIRTEVPEHLKSGLEKELDELELKRKGIVRAAQKALMLYGGGAPQVPGAPSITPAEEPVEERPKDIITEFEVAYKDFESTRTKIKGTLEKMGLKVEDVYMKKDEVEKLIEETKRQAAEDAIDDKRIDAVANIVRDAVTKIIEMFKPAVAAYFTSAPEEAPESSIQEGVEPGTAEQGHKARRKAGAKAS